MSTTFGAWLKQRRATLGVTQDQFARRLGFSPAMLRKLESGERRPSGQIAVLLADYFRIPADEREAFVTFARTEQVTLPDGEAESGNVADSIHTPWLRAVTRQTKTNLPALLTHLIGREEEVKALSDLLTHPKTRLVTLAGAPGIGKTRLGLQVASDLVESFGDGVFLVELAPVFDPNLVLRTIAHTLGLTEADDQSIDDLVLAYVRERRILLVLDNFEQVLDAAPLVVKLLERSPRLKVLVTSREALHVRGERRFPVSPLSLPEVGHVPSFTELMAYPSIELFVERSRMSRPEFALSEQNAASVAGICHALDGLPLAIELAAGHSGFYSPQEIEARLESRLQLLKTKARDLPGRHRTLRGAIEWSYNLLSVHERAVFRRLGVFVGGYTIEAASAVAGGSAAGMPAEDPRDALEALLDKSLITRGTHGSSANRERPGHTGEGVGRLGMLETLREYALDQLVACGEEGETRDRHARYYLAFVQEEEEHFAGVEVIGWIERVGVEYNNVREALGWLLGGEERSGPANHEAEDGGREGRVEIERIRLGVDLCTALFPFWGAQHTYLSEARAWYTKAAERIATLAEAIGYKDHDATAIRKASELSPDLPAAWARMLTGAGAMSYYQYDLDEARVLNEQGLAIRREIGDTSGVAACLNNLGNDATDRGDHEAARHYLSESLEISRELGVSWKIYSALRNLGIVETRLGNFVEARVFLEEAIGITRETEFIQGIAESLTSLGVVARLEGKYVEARAYLDEALAKFGQFDHKAGMAQVRVELGTVEREVGNYDEARALYTGSLHNLVEIGQKLQSFACFEGLASLAGKQGQPERAARLYGAAERLREITGNLLSLFERQENDPYLAAALHQLDEEQWRTAWAEGRAMTIDEAIAYSLNT